MFFKMSILPGIAGRFGFGSRSLIYRRSGFCCCCCHQKILRSFSTTVSRIPKNVDPPPKSYSDTLNLPKSKFPMKHSRQLELDLEKNTGFHDLYRDEVLKCREEYILHDGPPYANGDVHFGHSINKTLKDMFVKRKILEGHSVTYTHGWDCHGLPIELKALTEDQARGLSPLEIRARARDLATEAMARQRTSFSSWFLEGDLARPYRTYDIGYSLRELDAFYRLYLDGLIFRDYMPVYWSPSTRTALAEAELQYNQEHISRAAYVRYLVTNPEILDHQGSSVYAMIWTTTPWTLMANEGIAFSESIDYSLISLDENSDSYLVATELISVLREKLPGREISLIRSGIPSSVLSNLLYHDPLNPGTEKIFLPSGHVSVSKGGTGQVHLAPNHGFDDYKLFQLNGSRSYRKKDSVVDSLGRLRLPEPYEPVEIADQDNRASRMVLENVLPSDSVVHVEDHRHSYPYDWRSGKPVLILPSAQWFLSIDQIRAQCLTALDDVKIYPEKLRKELRHQISSRPNWCLSRQRNWGVPIPVFYDQASDPDRMKPVLSDDIFRRVMERFREGGLDEWWRCSPRELLGTGAPESLVKGEDIFDIWFDSGCSWLSVLGPEVVADLYSEGIDQIRGWFQSSLITSVALRGCAPYRALFIHGFSLDKDGKKMSKSIGNVIDPMDIIEDRLEKYLVEPELMEPEKEKGLKNQGSKNTGFKYHEQKNPTESKKKKPKSIGNCGLDGLRFWIARNGCTHSDVHVDVKDFREDVLTTVNRFRNTFRFLLGYLVDYTFTATTNSIAQNLLLTPQEYPKMPLLDRYLLVLLARFHRAANQSYSELNLGTVTEDSIRFFLYDVATFYLSRVKDRLYCEDSSSVGFRSAYTVLWYVYHTVGFQLAPILPHIVLEANAEFPFKRYELFDWDLGSEEEELTKQMSTVLRLIGTLNQWAGTSHRLMEYDCRIESVDEEILGHLKVLQPDSTVSFKSDLAELLQVASVSWNHQESILNNTIDSNSSERYRLRPVINSATVNNTEDSSSSSMEVESLSSSSVPESFSEQEESRFEIELVRTRFGLCPRCRRFTLDCQGGQGQGQLCDRCADAVQRCSC